MRRIIAALLVLASVAPAAARPAQCEVTDEGAYPCDFKPMGRDGSFEITARGKPRYAIVVDAPGEASAFSTFPPGKRNVSLPGVYKRDPKDPACWVNDEPAVRICVR